MNELPTGTVTFLFTDVQGSTYLWEHHPEAMCRALARHDAIVKSLMDQHGGQVVRPRGEGDSRFCVFARANDAVAAAAAIQRALHEEPWPPQTPLRVRMALHTGEADVRDGDYYELGLFHPAVWSNRSPIYADGYSDAPDAVDRRDHVSVPQGPGLGVTLN